MECDKDARTILLDSSFKGSFCSLEMVIQRVKFSAIPVCFDVIDDIYAIEVRNENDGIFGYVVAPQQHPQRIFKRDEVRALDSLRKTVCLCMEKRQEKWLVVIDHMRKPVRRVSFAIVYRILLRSNE